MLNGAFGFNLSGIIPTSALVEEIMYEETSNIYQNVLPDFLTCDGIKFCLTVSSQTGSATLYVEELWSAFSPSTWRYLNPSS
jgi:hypothetical protein